MPTNPNMVAIQTVTVGSGGAANIDFQNIPQTYTDLILKISVAKTTGDNVLISFNNSTANFSYRLLEGDGATVASYTNTTGRLAYASQTTSLFTSIDVYIPNYAGSTNKSYSVDAVSENNATTAYADLTAGLWSNTAAINRVTINAQSGNFVQHSTATLFGVTSAAVGAKATGGIITSDANYIYHTFFASGTFTPTQNLTADYLVVAGGGGGGGRRGGGGGAGGLRCTVGATGGGGSLESALSLTSSTNYTVTVGAGGAGGSGAIVSGGNSGSVGTSGSNSVFGSITSTGGGGGSGDGFGTGAGLTGGSGGGGSGGAGGTGTANQGYAGGSGSNSAPNYGGGGGGGAGAVGANGTSTAGGNGGNGVTTAISGLSTVYAGGGGGGTYQGGTAGTGGTGGGGAAGTGGTDNSGTAGTANLGGGGGAGSIQADSSNRAGGNGGSGIVIVRYAK